MRIFITGNAASGKTTLSKVLAAQTNLPVISLDRIVWLPKWQRQSSEKIRDALSNIICQETWIIEGVSSYVMEHADIIIFLDVPIYLAYWRAFKRTVKHLFKQRAEMPKSCPELLGTKKLIKIIWIFHHKVRSNILEQLKKYQDTKKTHHITNQTELQKLKWCA